jgi:hypothetical protein
MLVVKDVEKNTRKFLIYRRLKLFRTAWGSQFEPLARFVEKLIYLKHFRLASYKMP